MRGAEGGAQAAPPLQHLLFDELDQSLAELVFDQPLVAVIDGEREEGAAGMIDADKRAVRDEVQALNTTIIGMRAPADIREQAGRMAEPPLLGRLHRPRCTEQSIGPGAQLISAVDRARPTAGDVVAGRNQHVLALLLRA